MLDSKTLGEHAARAGQQGAARAGVPWPGRPIRAAMFLSFDVDAESAWTSKDPAHAERLVTM